MFFEELFKNWSKKDLLSQAITDSNEMFAIARKFYNSVSEALLDSDKAEKLDKEIVKKKDYLLNHFEKSIRKKAFEHMSVSDKKDQNLYYGIILMTVTSDIERLGDYCKNIYEVVELRDRLQNQELNTFTGVCLEAVRTMFKNTKDAFENSDSEKAKLVINKHFEIKTKIDDTLMELAKKETEENLVLYALLFRYLKRLSSHLRNICTATTNPIDKIGYYSKKINEDD